MERDQRLQTDLSLPPPPERAGGLGRIWAIVGIVAGFFLVIVPGVLAIRSYRRWRAGSIRRPTFAWACAWIGIPTIAWITYSTWALYNLPLVEDDFSDPASGWPVEETLDSSVGYEGGTYRIEAQGPDAVEAFLVWEEGVLPNVSAEADVLLHSGDRASAAFGVGCVEPNGDGYSFLVGFGGQFGIGRVDEVGETLVTGQTPPAALAQGSPTRIRGECRGGFGETRLAMYVNGTKVAEATDPDNDGYRSFTALRLVAVSGDENPIDVRFDNAYVIALQPS